MLKLFRERLGDPGGGHPVTGAVAHANAPVWADRLRELLETELGASELMVGEMGPVVGTHAGPGTVGAALFRPADDEEAALVAPIETD
jgi:fatty acid-binding protein DegV